MPSRPYRKCSHPGCDELTRDAKCEAHAICNDKEYDDRRGSSRDRGYDYKWEKARARWIRLHPLCEECLTNDIVHIAEEVHHIRGIENDPEHQDLMSLCRACHDKTKHVVQ